ncbi:PREDICTED: uncharacterized protein LOC108662039 [Theobroma cacao]|uniref:Uncharacterized protein LOC108662039 n=1 Tax=Theobroma cacao TaxID=3641 RepID=A0AB32WCM8_THECC|nr:PREDICTED: uncharacterized protein LOC108662039 [Theobroma cacao]
MRQAIRSKSHQHPLFYFGTECQNLFASMLNYEFFRQHFLFKCNKCYKSFGGVPFYRCVLCCINFHLECVPIPHFIKSKCHIHPFTLRHCFLEDDSEKYFCDVCEEERHPKNHVYVCEECQGLFVAHIECVLDNMVEEIAPAEDPSSNLVPDLENTFVQAEREVPTDESKEEQQSNNVSPAMKERAAE